MRQERKVVTVLFCDIVGSTAIAEQLDPEEWAEIVNGAFQVLTEPVAHYEGTVVRLLGDSILAFFGAPVSHEDDPRRAVLAALEMIDALPPFREQVRKDYGIDFNVRVGINTGSVVVGDVGSSVLTEYTALGDAVNVAARMQQTAAPGTIVIGHDTQRLVAPLFELQALGDIEVKGKSEPVSAFRVLETKAQPGRTRGLEGVSAPLVGRDKELAQIKELLARLHEGRGGIVTIIGEAGLGKSRLLEETRAEWVRDHPATSWFQIQGSPYDTSRPYGLYQKFAREMAGIDNDDPPDVIHQKIDSGLRAIGAPEEVVALCSVALERIIAVKVLHDARDFAPEIVRRDIEHITYPAWRTSALSGPVVKVLDDLQWADQASVDLLLHLFGLVEEVPILFICAFRPERQSPAWQVKTRAETDYPHRYTEIVLQPLDAEQTNDLVNALLHIADLPDALRQLILRKTEGNPYFVEEIVRSLIDEGVVYRTDDGLRWKSDTKVDDITIPDTLQALLMARIDRLDRDTRSTLQLASVIGRSFYAKVLKAISDSTMALDKHLTALQRVELVREAMRLPELEYIFKHELARDAAYSSILNRKRRELHLRVARAMETLFPDRLAEHANRLAVHFAAAGDAGRALHYRVMAGEAAVAVGANVDAAAHFASAIEAAELLGTPEPKLAELRQRHQHLASLIAARVVAS
jgi:class 3 adenylate cyclase/Cdc6-like AAA superfamily ATPase